MKTSRGLEILSAISVLIFVTFCVLQFIFLPFYWGIGTVVCGILIRLGSLADFCLDSEEEEEEEEEHEKPEENNQ